MFLKAQWIDFAIAAIFFVLFLIYRDVWILIAAAVIAGYNIIKYSWVYPETRHNLIRELMKGLPYPFAYVNRQGKMVLQNDLFVKLAESKVKNIQDDGFNIFVRQVLVRSFNKYSQTSSQYNINGIDYQVIRVPVFDREKYDGYFVIFQDITRMIEGEKMQKRFIADASHELKTPIASIKGMSEILVSPDFEGDEDVRQDFLKQIAIESTRLERIVSDLLFQSRLSENKIFLDKAPFNLLELLQEVAHQFKSKLEYHQIQLKIECSSDVRINGDRFRMQQVFNNLMQNAINYAAGTKIEIKVKRRQQQIYIYFKDYGEGISEEDLKHIFDRFYRSSIDRNRYNGGSGLGLPIVKAIISAHDGTINVKSKLKEFTEFTIELTEN